MEEVISEKAARILDLLEQIDSINHMISLYDDDEFMKDQYIYRKGRFVKKLATQLSKYGIGKADLTT